MLAGQAVNVATGSVAFVLIIVGRTGLDLVDNLVAAVPTTITLSARSSPVKPTMMSTNATPPVATFTVWPASMMRSGVEPCS